MERSTILDSIRSHPDVSVLIVGAGVNGIGLFRDLALQGVDVLIIDRDDFCSGASAGSSHMVHGGLRYLENGEFRLVREALTERNLLLRNAPHYVKPLPTTIPIFKRFSGFLNAPLKFFQLRDKPGERGAVIIKIGLMLYDFYARKYRVMPTHKFMSRAQSLEKYPKLNPDIVNTVTYYDAWMPYPERICMEMVLDAEAASSTATALNYVALDSASGDTVTLRDTLTDETLTVKPKIVVNAAGPWIDFANDAMGHDRRLISGTKGSHLVLDHPELHQMLDGHEIFFENKDGRIVLIFPLMDKVLVGTTDIRIDNPDDAVCTDEETDYILNMIQRVFPTMVVNQSHIVFTFSGVRPLRYSEAATPGQIYRDHSMSVIEASHGINFPIYALIGGKWTTFRAFAEQAANAILARVGKPRHLSTTHIPIGGGADYPADGQHDQWIQGVADGTGTAVDRVKTLFTRYGTRAKALAAYIAGGEDTPLTHMPNYSKREIQFLVEHEKVVHVDDVLLRRSLLGMLGQVNRALLAEIASIMKPALGWSDAQAQAEIERTVDIFKRKHKVNLE